MKSKISEHYRRLHRSWNIQAKTGEIKDEDNPVFLFSLTKTELLEKVAKGELDVQQLALLELENRKPYIRTYSAYDSRGRKVKVTIPD